VFPIFNKGHAAMNRRSSDRITTEAIVRILHENEVYYSISADISLGGINVVCRLNFSKGDILDIEFSIPQSNLSKPVKCKVKVLRSSIYEGNHHLHCSFVEISDMDTARFEEALNSLIIEAWFVSDEEKPVKTGPYKSDQRAHHRVPIKMWITNKDVDEHIHLPAENLSIGGMYMITPAKHEPGSVLEIAFNLPGTGHTMEAVVTVVNIRPVGAMWGTGLKFIGLSDEDREVLEKVVSSDITARWFVPESEEKE
jgi:hypothetical protein